MNIVLASKSASRRAMLEAAAVPFTAVPANVDERAIDAAMGPAASPSQVALALARAKALIVGADRPAELVLGSDSLVECEGSRFDKPESREAAAEHLRFFSGKVMHLHSAVVLAHGGEVLREDVQVAALHFISTLR